MRSCFCLLNCSQCMTEPPTELHRLRARSSDTEAAVRFYTWQTCCGTLGSADVNASPPSSTPASTLVPLKAQQVCHWEEPELSRALASHVIASAYGASGRIGREGWLKPALTSVPKAGASEWPIVNYASVTLPCLCSIPFFKLNCPSQHAWLTRHDHHERLLTCFSP